MICLNIFDASYGISACSELLKVNTKVCFLDWLQSLKQCFINVSYQILVASLTLMARAIRVRLATSI